MSLLGVITPVEWVTRRHSAQQQWILSIDTWTLLTWRRDQPQIVSSSHSRVMMRRVWGEGEISHIQDIITHVYLVSAVHSYSGSPRNMFSQTQIIFTLHCPLTGVEMVDHIISDVWWCSIWQCWWRVPDRLRYECGSLISSGPALLTVELGHCCCHHTAPHSPLTLCCHPWSHSLRSDSVWTSVTPPAEYSPVV